MISESFDNDIVKLSSASYGVEPFLAEDFFNIQDSGDEDDPGEDKTRVRFIRQIEKTIRGSYEYKKWLQFIKGTLGSDLQCYHTGNIPDVCSIEMHHHPYTLYNLVDIMLRNSDNDFSSLTIANRVMKLHFMNLVGFIPLCVSSHEMYHSNVLEIPIDLVEGNWHLLERKLDIPEDILDNINSKASLSLSNVRSKWFLDHKLFSLSEAKPVNIKNVDRSGWD